MTNIYEQIKNIESEIIKTQKGYKFNIKNLNLNLKRLISLQKIKELKDQEICLIEGIKLLALKTIANQLNTNKAPNLQNEKAGLSSFKKLFLLGSLFFTSLVSGFLGFIAGKNLLGLLISASNPYALAACFVIGFVESVIFLVSDGRAICHSYGVPFLKTSPRFKILKDQLNVTKQIHELVISNADNLNLKPYQETLNLIHDDLKEKNRLINKEIKTTILNRCLKGIGHFISGSVAMGSGFFLTQCALGLCAAALLTNPIGWVICGASALLSLSAFCFFRKNSVSKTVDKIMGRPGKFKADLNSFVKEDVENFDNKMASLLPSHRNLQVDSHRKNLIASSLKMKSKPSRVAFNSYNFNSGFFHLKKHVKIKTTTHSSYVIHSTRLS